MTLYRDQIEAQAQSYTDDLEGLAHDALVPTIHPMIRVSSRTSWIQAYGLDKNGVKSNAGLR